MASIDWPSTLPATPLVDGFRETTSNGRIFSQMDVGPAKVRRRTTAVTRYFYVEYIFTTTQKGYFDTFYETTTKFGTLAFDWTRPDTNTEVEARFKPDETPTASPDGVDVRVSFALEIV
jgi:hypothetical protein